MDKLPLSSRVIFHVDPTEQAIFTHTSVIANISLPYFEHYKEPTWQKEKPIFILQFSLDNSLYQIKIWNIDRYLR